MAEIFPSQLIKRDNPNLRLGIKSSLNSFKQLIASLYVIYKSTSSPKDVHYSDIEENNDIITICLAKDLSEKVSELFTPEIEVLLNKSPLFKSQIEALQVGIELFLQLGKISFVENGRQERTGENRYNKSLSFSDKMIIIDTYLSAFNRDIVQSLISHWLKGTDYSHYIEDGLKAILSTFIIDCCYKIKKTNGEDIVFNIENIYEALDSGNEVLFKDGEVVGPMRVLNSYIGENMLNDVVKTKNTYVVKDGRQDYLNKHLSMISTSLDLITRQLPFKDAASREDTHHNVTDSQNETYNVFISALRTKPFLLLAGISGTGKSRIVKKMAFDTCPDKDNLRKDETSPGNYQLIEVKPNWHDSTEVLGYESEIGGRHYVTTPFIKFLVKAMCYPEIPFFVCMDEMNLAPVEQYFAEFLSVLESRKLIDGKITSEPLLEADVFNKTYVPNYDIFVELGLEKVEQSMGKCENDILGANATTEAFKRHDIVWKLQNNGLRIPQNLIVIGTVNMDETTHQFSRKVIDRAMTIEMNIADGAEPFSDFFKNKEELSYRDTPICKDLFLSTFVQASEAMESLSEDDCKYLTYNVPQKLSELNSALNNTPFKIAYRVQNELVLLFASLRQEHDEIPAEELFASALDGILMMKVLPRIEGDEDLLEKPLDALVNYTQGLPQSLKKIMEMKGRLGRAHFTCFWP